MQPGDYSIDVGVREQTDELLKRLEDLPAGSKARLSVPRDAIALRALPDYNVLRDLQRRPRPTPRPHMAAPSTRPRCRPTAPTTRSPPWPRRPPCPNPIG
jgi:hypothetical protein